MRPDPLAPRRATTGSSALAPLIDRGLRTRRERARLIFERCRERLPHFREIPPELLEEALESGIRYQTLFYEVSLVEGRPATAEELEPLRRSARARVGQGISLVEYLWMIQESYKVLVEDFVGRVEGEAALNELRERLPIVHSNAMQLMAALTEAYVAERERRSHHRDRELSELFELLLAPGSGEADVDAASQHLGISLRGHHAVLVLRGPGASDDDGTAARLDEVRRLLAASRGGEPGWVGACREGFAALVSAELDAEAFARSAVAILGASARIGIGRAADGPAGACASAREALRSLELGSLQGERAVHRFDDVEVLDLVDVGSEGSIEFMRRVLGPLAEAGASRVYVDTLRALADHGFAIKPAAAALDVHPHTLTYRLKQIRSRHGIACDEPTARFRIQLALQIRDAVSADH